MQQGRSVVRPVALFVAGMLAMGIFAITPAGAHFKSKLGHLKKHFVSTKTISTFGQIRMNLGDPEVAIGKWGPFSLAAQCVGGDNGNVTGQIVIRTAEDNAAFQSVDDEDEDFDVADNNNPAIWADNQTSATGGADPNSYDAEGHAMAPSGAAIDGRTAVYLNFAGFDCVFAGHVTRTA